MQNSSQSALVPREQHQQLQQMIPQINQRISQKQKGFSNQQIFHSSIVQKQQDRLKEMYQQ